MWEVDETLVIDAQRSVMNIASKTDQDRSSQNHFADTYVATVCAMLITLTWCRSQKQAKFA
jgi:hypothetical protein